MRAVGGSGSSPSIRWRRVQTTIGWRSSSIFTAHLPAHRRPFPPAAPAAAAGSPSGPSRAPPPPRSPAPPAGPRRRDQVVLLLPGPDPPRVDAGELGHRADGVDGRLLVDNHPGFPPRGPQAFGGPPRVVR